MFCDTKSSKWFKNIKNNLIIDPNNDSFIKQRIIKNKVIKNKLWKTPCEPKIKYNDNPIFNYDEEEKKINDEFILKCNKLKENGKEKNILALTIKTKNKINNLNTVVKVNKYTLDLTKKQKVIISKWIDECKKVYNFCVEKNNTDNKYFSKGSLAVKATIFNELYGKNNKPCPYDILTDEVRIFYSNLKSCFSNLENGHIKHFEIKKKLKNNTNYSLLIPKKSIYKNGIFKTIFGNIKNLNLDELPKHDSRLFYNFKQQSYTLIIPTNINCVAIENREQICAIDPGEKIFATFYGLKSYGYIGKDIRKPLLNMRNKISKYQKILSKNKNKNESPIKNKKHIKNKIKKIYRKIKNLVKELHNQTSNYLCKNYDKILIPKFETQKMLKSDKTFKQYKKDLINEGKNFEEKRENAKKFTKKCRLNKNVKYVLNQLSHYNFRQHLSYKCEQYGCQIKIITEEYTSCTCSNCGFISNDYNKKRIKKCLNCKYKIDRDINGARNILLKNLGVFKYKAIKPKASYVPLDQ